MRLIVLILTIGCFLPVARSVAGSTDPLAPRDEDGLLHQMPVVMPTDLAPRRHCRLDYNFIAGDALTADPAYVGALQQSLHNLGYYCGPLDGVFSPEVSAAIARLEKNSSLRVTGTVTWEVRRALHLP